METDRREEQLCSIALTLIPRLSPGKAKSLIEGMGSAADVFRHRSELPDRLPDINPSIVSQLDCPAAFARAEKELAFAEKNNICCLTYTDKNYPLLLHECPDPPTVLFFKGEVEFNALHVLSIVGTRHATEYGTQLCHTFLHDLKEICPNVLVVSGLAYGIDIHAHREALANGLPTVGVLAHGLDRIYPQVHRATAIEMLKSGGLLTEYFPGTEPERYNFVGRNRIVAGMAEATLVVESPRKGGSLITADLAVGYGRECFAFPGRIGDVNSEGCNRLISENKAAILLSAEELVEAMNWRNAAHKPQAPVQRNLFPDLSDDEQKIVGILRKEGALQINSLVVESAIPVAQVNALLFELEMKGVIRVMAGGMYSLLS